MAAPAKRRGSGVPQRDVAQRNVLVQRLYDQGESVPDLASVTGLDERTIRRIVRPRLGRGPMPAGEMRHDRRRNGALYEPWEPEATNDLDSLDLDEEEGVV